MTEESGEAARSLLGHTDAEVLGKPMAQLSKVKLIQTHVHKVSYRIKCLVTPFDVWSVYTLFEPVITQRSVSIHSSRASALGRKTVPLLSNSLKNLQPLPKIQKCLTRPSDPGFYRWEEGKAFWIRGGTWSPQVWKISDPHYCIG